MRRVAVIDLGTNTCRLLVADVGEGGLSRIAEERNFTRIGAAMGGGDRIPEEKIREVAEVAGEFAAIGRSHGAEGIEIVATAAMREAANASDLERALAEHGRVRVIGEEEEARLTFAGAVAVAGEVPGPVGVADVGGGSTELVAGDEASGGVAWFRSRPMGSNRITQQALVSDPPTGKEIEVGRGLAAEALHGLEPPPVETLLAVGGSASSTARIVGSRLDREAIARALDALVEGSAADMAARLGIAPERARLLPGGLLVLEAVVRLWGRPLTIVRGGVREGEALRLAQSAGSTVPFEPPGSPPAR